MITPIVGVCNCSMFCCTLLYVHSSIVLQKILMGKRELVALLNLSSWCLVMIEACIGVLGIQDICRFTSRDIRYYPFYFQGY